MQPVKALQAIAMQGAVGSSEDPVVFLYMMREVQLPPQVTECDVKAMVMLDSCSAVNASPLQNSTSALSNPGSKLLQAASGEMVTHH